MEKQATDNQTTTSASIVEYRYMLRSESPLVAKFQYEMAKETEGKELNTVEVTKAVEFISDNPNRGFYIVSSVGQEGT